LRPTQLWPTASLSKSLLQTRGLLCPENGTKAAMIRFLIDGYNFLNASGIDTQRFDFSGATPLERSRLALLDFLVTHLTPEEISETVVVFDARHFLRPQADEFTYHGLTVRFAARYPDADSLLEEMIQSHSAPKQLTVISSDHRIQRAARRRRAKFIDSESWYRHLCARHHRQGTTIQSKAGTEDKEVVNLSPHELKHWLEEFASSCKLSEETPHSVSETRRPESNDREHLTSGNSGNEAGPSKLDMTDAMPNLSAYSVEEWAKHLGVSPDKLNLPIDAFKDIETPNKTQHGKRKRRQ